MPNYIATQNPWTAAAGIGNDAAEGIARLAVQIPYLRLAQQRAAQEAELHRSQAEMYGAHTKYYGAEQALTETKTQQLKDKARLDHEKGLAVGDFMASRLRNDPQDVLIPKAQAAATALMSVAQENPEHAMDAVARMVEIFRSQGLDPASELAFLTGNAGALRPPVVGAGAQLESTTGAPLGVQVPFRAIAMSPEQQLVNPGTGRVTLPPTSFNLKPGESVMSNPEYYRRQPPVFDPATMDFTRPAPVPAPIISPVPQREASQPNLSTLIGSGLDMGAFNPALRGTNAPSQLEQQIYMNAAQKMGLLPPGPGQGTGPKVGEVRKGYRFLGGDPSKPESWQKIP